jgi:hypothetical protein
MGFCGCAGWSGSMLVANPLCWFCHGVAQIVSSKTVITSESFQNYLILFVCLFVSFYAFFQQYFNHIGG